MKKYIADSCVSVSVVLRSGKSCRVSFNPITGAGSVYYTADKELQEALERHPRYGRLFRLAKEIKAESAEEPREQARTEVKEVSVSDLGMAKEYLSDKFGLNRTKLKTKSAIIKAAADCGVKFVGLD